MSIDSNWGVEGWGIAGPLNVCGGGGVGRGGEECGGGGGGGGAVVVELLTPRRKGERVWFGNGRGNERGQVDDTDDGGILRMGVCEVVGGGAMGGGAWGGGRGSEGGGEGWGGGS